MSDGETAAGNETNFQAGSIESAASAAVHVQEWLARTAEWEARKPRGAITTHIEEQLTDLHHWLTASPRLFVDGNWTPLLQAWAISESQLVEVRTAWPMSEGCLDDAANQLNTVFALDRILAGFVTSALRALDSATAPEVRTWLAHEISNQNSRMRARSLQQSSLFSLVQNEDQRKNAAPELITGEVPPGVAKALAVVVALLTWLVLAPTGNSELLWQLFTVAIGSSALTLFFRVVETQWPENYYAFDTPTDPIVSRDPLRYGLFRLAPVYLVCLFAAVSLERARYPAWWVVVAIAALHLGATTMRGVVGIATGSIPAAARAGRVVYHATVVVGAITAALLALGWHSALQDLIPELPALADAFWTAVAAAIVGAFLLSRIRSTGDNVGPLIRRSTREIPADLISHAKRAAQREEIDWPFFFAILTAENLQRPAWTRRFERIAGRIFRSRGSYGLMQVQAPVPITDTESIDRAALLLAGATIRPTPPTWLGARPIPNADEVRRLARSYNHDDRYAAFVEKIYFAVDQQPSLLP